jgi:hypothetical protein
MVDEQRPPHSEESLGDLFSAWRMVIGLPIEAVVAAFEPSADDVIADGNYQCLEGLTIVHAPPPSPGSLYLRDDQVVLMYVDHLERWPQITSDAIVQTLGEPDQVLRSRAGRGASLLLYATAGFAVSVSESVDFVEVFAPTTVAAYTDDVYSVPLFRR